VRIVLLHALPLDGSMWAPLSADADWPVLSPTLYPLGETIEAWAEGVLDTAGPGPLVVIGNSIGGSCAIEMARLAPERVHLMVLMGAKPGHRREPDLRDAAVHLLAEAGMAAAWSKYWEPLFAPDASSDAVDAARSIALRQDVDQIIRGVRVFHDRPDRTAFLERWPGPILVVSGEHDRTPRNGAQLAASLPHGTFRLVHGAGHYVSFERPAALGAILQEACGYLSPIPSRRLRGGQRSYSKSGELVP
jgi:pimeloyl-ACP methyl ester carboxylesterase